CVGPMCHSGQLPGHDVTTPMPNPVWMKKYDQQLALQKLLDGNCFGVFIDDTGSPGMPNAPAKLHPARKSWVAVVVPPNQVCPVTNAANEALDALRFDLGVNEFHF